LTDRIGTPALSKKYGVSDSVLRRWIRAWQHHGEAGLRKKYEAYSAEFKLNVLRRMWHDELSYQQVSALFDLRETSGVSRWERQYHEGGIDALKPRPKGRPPHMSQPKQDPQPTPEPTQDERPREDLLKENEYLRAEVAYLKKLDALLRAKQQGPKKKPKSSARCASGIRCRACSRTRTSRVVRTTTRWRQARQTIATVRSRTAFSSSTLSTKVDMDTAGSRLRYVRQAHW